MANRKIEVAITGDARSLERAFGRASKSSDSFGRKIGRGAGKGLLGLAKVAGVASVAVGVGFAAAVRHGMKGLSEQAKVTAQTEAALKSTGNAAKTSAAQIRELTESLERKTGIDADQIQVGSNLLLTFTKIRNEVGKGNDIFDQANQTALDMSVTFGTSMKSASIQLGKALNDPVKGVTALQRSGISFTQSQKDQIKALTESGKVLEAQKLILAEVNTQVGGSAEAMGKTFPGQVQRAKRAFEQLTETLATPFMDVFSSGLEGALNIFSDPAVQAGIASFGQRVAAGLQTVVTWLRANWPQIKTVILTVFDALQTYYNTIVIPVFSGVISIIGRAVEFIRQNMPQIRAAVQAAFDWIKVNVIPTVQSVARNVQRFVALMTRIWREHGDDIKAVVGPVFQTIKIIVGTVLGNIKSVIEIILALIRGDFDAAGEAFKDIIRRSFGALKAIATVGLRVLAAVVKILAREVVQKLSEGLDAIKRNVRAKFNAAKDAISEVAGTIASAAADVGRRIVDGVLDGLGGLYSRMKEKLESTLRDVINKLNPFSPVEHGGIIIARRLADGTVRGIKQNKPRIAAALSEAVRSAVFDARSNVASLGGGLASMLGTLFGTSSAEAKRLAEIRAQQSAEDVRRQREQLRAAVDQTRERADIDEDYARDRSALERDLASKLASARSISQRQDAQREFNDAILELDRQKNARLAELDREREAARQALADFELDQEAAQLEESIRQKQEAYERDIANLAEAFNQGQISAEQFRAALNDLIGGQTGAELGLAFAGEFQRQIEAIFGQIAALFGAPFGLSGPGITRPGAVASEELRDWRQRRAARRKQLEDNAKKKDSDGGEKITQKEKNQINAAMKAWNKNNPQPRQLADGGVLRKAVLAGEAGPEAVLPLSSGRAQRMLAEAMDGADKLRGASGGNTIIHVTVNGNEFSAHEFARKIAPELRRQVSLIRSA
jgi:phage-related protein